MEKLQKLGGLAAISEAVIYISAFTFYGAFWHYPSDSSAVQKFAFLAENQTVLSIMNLLMYVIFGIILAVLLLALHHRLKDKAPILAKISALFGIIWVGLVIASGMIANVGLTAVIGLADIQPQQAMTVQLCR